MNEFRSKLPMVLLLSGLLAATIALFEPIKSAIWNWSEISLGFEALLARLALPFAGAWLGIAGVAALSSAAAPNRAISVLVALCVALWAQGNLFVWSYGSFDGSPIDWSEHSSKGVLEIALWVSAFALALVKPGWICERARRIAAIVFALQVAAIGGQIHQNAPLPAKPDSAEPASIQHVSLYSRDLNVIIIVLDGLQSDLFSEAMRDPDLLAAMPPGFTYYRNATALYPMTGHSMPTILTSRTIPNDARGKEWLAAQMADSLPTRLAEQGFEGVVATSTALLRPHSGAWGYEYVTNETLAEAGSANAAWRKDISDVFALGAFRLVPHFIKPLIYDDGQWRIRRLYPQREVVARDPKISEQTRTDLAVFDELIASASAGDTPPQFRLFHFYGSHRPYTADKSCSRRILGPIRKRAIETTQCMLSRTYEFLHKLDEIGVYDGSLIFVVADHGARKIPLDVSVARPKIRESETPDRPASDNTEPIDWYGRGVPVFLAKPLGDRNSLRVSDAPVSLCDVPKSVLDSMAVEHDFECESIFSEQISLRKPRIMHLRKMNDKMRKSLGLPPATPGLTNEKIAVVGHSWLAESWVPIDANPH
jgi:hypothetical protein